MFSHTLLSRIFDHTLLVKNVWPRTRKPVGCTGVPAVTSHLQVRTVYQGCVSGSH